MSEQKLWQFWVDRGGTFTDIVALDPKGELHTHKLLSENPEQYPDAALAGIRYFLNVPQTQPIPVEQIRCVKMGTTVATNALLERKGEAVALVTQQGFADALEIGYQHRPDIFALNIQKPTPLYQTAIEVAGRLDAQGKWLEPLDEPATKRALQTLFAQGYRALAVVFMHAYLNPEVELTIAQWARDIGFSQVSTSSETSALIKMIARGRTTVVDAYLSPILRRYVEQVSKELPNVDLSFMQSHGGLCQAENFQGKDAILSGPAGGIIGAIASAHSLNRHQVIGFDMGGTSTDVSHYAGKLERSFETEIAGTQMRVPMLDIHTVAAGGGSIISVNNGEIRVGPESAGANPGPAAYRRGGPLSVTDANVLLGRIQAQHFPQVFGPNANQPLDRNTVQTQFTQLAEPLGMSAEALAEGALQIAVETMAQAISKISTQRGYDLSDYTLISFGGAGGQHACAVAESLGIQRLLQHPFSGVLSAFGMGLAEMRELSTQSCHLALSDLAAIEAEIQTLIAHNTQQLAQQNSQAERHEIRLQLHYQGSDSLLNTPLEFPLMRNLKEQLINLQLSFEKSHQQQFGFILPNTPIAIAAFEHHHRKCHP